MEGIIEVSDGSGAGWIVCICGYVYKHLCTYAKSCVRLLNSRMCRFVRALVSDHMLREGDDSGER